MGEKVNQEGAENQKPSNEPVGTRKIVKVVNEVISVTEVAHEKLWLAANFAQKWFEDALKEARTGSGPDSVRREIIFAVCFAESYNLEWVRDTVLERDFQRLTRYFPADEKRPIERKWKEIPKELKRDNLVPSTPNLSKASGKNGYWTRFQTLVKYRNGLIHASISRPETKGQPVDESPSPSPTTLNQIQSGWATQIVMDLVRDVHQATGTSVPDWLVDP